MLMITAENRWLLFADNIRDVTDSDSESDSDGIQQFLQNPKSDG